MTKRFFLLGAIAVLTACSVKQLELDSQLSPSSSDITYVLQESVVVRIPNSSDTALRAGTRWREVGTIAQGTVFRTKDQVVIVNSFNVHEGYVVANDGKIVGFYLPIAKTFVASKPVSLTLE